MNHPVERLALSGMALNRFRNDTALGGPTLTPAPAELPMPLRRGVEVKLARLQAQDLARQGDIDAALNMARKGAFGLVDDHEHVDPLGTSMLDWLMQIGRHDEAAALAFNSAYVHNDSTRHACAMAQQQVATSTNPHWALTLAAATLNEATQDGASDDLRSSFKHHWDLAAELDPQHPALEPLHALFMYRHDEAHDPATVLTLLEATAQRQSPSLMTTTVLETLWTLRVRLHGPERAVALPFPATFSGARCYAAGCLLNAFDAKFPELSDWPTAKFKALSARYYAEGLARFEAFFATGEGAFGDANVLPYSALCNNLAIYRREDESDAPAAIELHQKGLAAGPFDAQHIAGLMSCHECLQDRSSYVSTANRLWHYSAEYGDSPHVPLNYIGRVSSALYSLGRDNEIAIWLQRLEKWWAAQDEPTRSDPDTEGDYLNTLCRLVANIARCQPKEAMAKIDLVLERARSSGQGLALSKLGLAAERARQPERALALYQEAEALILARNPLNERDLGMAREGIKACAQALRAPRPWWRFWG